MSDLRHWLRSEPRRVAECSQCLRVLQVNRRTLELYGASSLEHLVDNLPQGFRDDASERYARGLFEHSPISLWVEGFSSVKRLLDEAREQGIANFRTFTDVHPEFMARCMDEIRVIDANQQTLTMFAAPDNDSLLKRRGEVFRDDMQAHFTEQLLDLWHGKTFHQREVVNYTLSGDKLHVYLQFSVLPDHEHDRGLVLISLSDITAHIGGGEFVILLPGTDERGGTQLLERLRTLIDLNNQFYGGRPSRSHSQPGRPRDARRQEGLLHRQRRQPAARRLRRRGGDYAVRACPTRWPWKYASSNTE